MRKKYEREKTPKRVYSIYIPINLHEKILVTAESEGASFSSFVQAIVEEHLGKR